MPEQPPSPSKCRLRFFVCLLAGMILAIFGVSRWSPFTDFRYVGGSDSLIATLDYGAAAAFLLAGPLLLTGWRRGRFTRPEGVPEIAVMAIGSLMAGGFCFLLWIGAVRGLVRAF